MVHCVYTHNPRWRDNSGTFDWSTDVDALDTLEGRTVTHWWQWSQINDLCDFKTVKIRYLHSTTVRRPTVIVYCPNRFILTAYYYYQCWKQDQNRDQNNKTKTKTNVVIFHITRPNKSEASAALSNNVWNKIAF